MPKLLICSFGLYIIDIEKRDSNKENISHFLLQYHVNEDSFLNFTMKIASEYIEKELDALRPTLLHL